MPNKPDVIIGEDSVTLVGSGDSPVVDIEGGNHWNLSQSVGDLRIGDDDNMINMGVALDGGGAGNGSIRATSDLKLGGHGESVVSIDANGIHPDNDAYSLGSHTNRWSGLWLDGNTSIVGADFTLDADSTLKAEGSVLFSGQLGLAAEIVGDVLPPGSGGYNIGDSDHRWGTLYVNSVDKSSDRRLKTDIEELNDGLETLLDLRPVSYSLKSNGDDTHLGLIGQEVADVLPEIVNKQEDDDGFLGIDYMELVAVIVAAIQTQQEQRKELEECVDRQQERIKRQQHQIDDLENRLAALEDAV